MQRKYKTKKKQKNKESEARSLSGVSSITINLIHLGSSDRKKRETAGEQQYNNIATHRQLLLSTISYCPSSLRVAHVAKALYFFHRRRYPPEATKSGAELRDLQLLNGLV